MYTKWLIRNQVDLNKNDRFYSIFAINLLVKHISRFCRQIQPNAETDGYGSVVKIEFAANLRENG